MMLARKADCHSGAGKVQPLKDHEQRLKDHELRLRKSRMFVSGLYAKLERSSIPAVRRISLIQIGSHGSINPPYHGETQGEIGRYRSSFAELQATGGSDRSRSDYGPTMQERKEQMFRNMEKATRRFLDKQEEYENTYDDNKASK